MPDSDHAVPKPATGGPGGPFEDRVDFARTESELRHRLFGAPRKAPRLGRFEVVGTAGAGAMGRVYIAYDPELDRTVAIKVVRDVGLDHNEAEQRRARLAGEARALAKVSDRNVIAIYEVGDRDGELFIVMEYVPGPDLRSWRAARRGDLAQIEPVLLGAADGLAAAHRAGLVHRDFKPENIVVCEGPRAVVLDFGLARSAAAAVTVEDGLGTDLGTPGRATRTGARAGTPAYMAPELFAGEPPSFSSDQFAFCVVAWEALTGERPFEDYQGQAAPPRRKTPPPPSTYRQVLERGLSEDPDDRWPSVEVLVAQLRRAGTRIRRRWIAFAAGIGGLVVAGTLAYERHAAASALAACEARGSAITEVWNAEQRELVKAGLDASGASYAGTTATHVLPVLDAHAGAWQAAASQACMDAEIERTWDAATYAKATSCLEGQRLQLQALTNQLREADTTTVRNAVRAAQQLGQPEVCVDPDVLSHMPAAEPPREQGDRLRRALARAGALAGAGRYAAGVDVAQQAVSDARAMDAGSLLAAARLQEGQLLDKTGEAAEAEAALADAYFEAVRIGDHGLAHDAASALVFTVGHSLARPDDGALWARHALSQLDALGGVRTGLREAETSSQLAVVRREAGSLEEARDLSERALQLRESVLGPDHLLVATSVGDLASAVEALGDPTRARALHERALRIKRAALGPEHPSIARTINNLAGALEASGDLTAAMPLRTNALSILERVHGARHPTVASALANLANLQRRQGQPALAVTHQRRALEILEVEQGATHPNVGIALGNLAGMLEETGALEEARLAYLRAIPILEDSLGAEHPHVARFLSNEAGLLMALGSPEQAKPRLERALEILAAALGPDHPALASATNNLGSVYEALGDAAQARVYRERASVLASNEVHP